MNVSNTKGHCHEIDFFFLSWRPYIFSCKSFQTQNCHEAIKFPNMYTKNLIQALNWVIKEPESWTVWTQIKLERT